MPEGRNLRLIDLGGIGVMDNRLRALRPEVVNELADSIRMQGLLHPIILRPRSKTGIGYLLVVGQHRLEAVRKLHKAGHWPSGSIRAEIVDDMEADAALFAEIDENLIRADLSPAERAKHVDARKTLYERIHPQTKQGKAPAKKGGKGGKTAKMASLPDAFTQDTAKKTGKSKRAVERDATRGKKVKVLDQVTGTCLDKGEELDALAKLDEAEQRKLADQAKAGEKVSAKTRVKQVKRTSREETLGQKQIALPLKRFGVIAADPEWKFETRSEAGMDRSAENHYPTSDLATIKARDVASIAADDCVLFLWTTVPVLPQALEVMAAWGFKYVSNFVWVKNRVSTGYWNRNKHELLLLGTKGNIPAPAPGTQWDSVLPGAVGEHSEKPESWLELIEAYFPTLPKIELNRRGPARPGWDAWGNEVENAA